MKKRVLALFMVLALVLGCTACQSQNSSTPDGGESSSPTSEENNSSSEASAENTAEDGEYPVLRFNMTYTTEPRIKSAEVTEALNEVLREKAGAEVEPVWVAFADFKTQLNLMLVGGDDSLDFFTSF